MYCIWAAKFNGNSATKCCHNVAGRLYWLLLRLKDYKNVRKMGLMWNQWKKVKIMKVFYFSEKIQKSKRPLNCKMVNSYRKLEWKSVLLFTRMKVKDLNRLLYERRIVHISHSQAKQLQRRTLIILLW